MNISKLFFSCLPGQHPRLRWNRRRRSVEMKFIRSRYLLSNYRRLQRHSAELQSNNNDVQPLHRQKRHTFERSAASRLFGVQKRQRYSTGRRTHNTNDLDEDSHHRHRRVSRNVNDMIQRQLRQPFHGEEAYDKWMDQLKQKYQKYVKNILGHNNIKHIQNHSDASTNMVHRHSLANRENTMRPLIAPQPLPLNEKDFHMNSHRDNQKHFDSNIFTISRPSYHRPTQKPQTEQNIYNFNYRPAKNPEPIIDVEAAAAYRPAFYNNTYHVAGDDHRMSSAQQVFAQNRYSVLQSNQWHRPADTNAETPPTNVSDLIAKLNAQIVRRKRNAAGADTGQKAVGRKNGRRNLNGTTVTGATVVTPTVTPIIIDPIESTVSAPAPVGDSDLDELKRGKPKSPCEVRLRRFL